MKITATQYAKTLHEITAGKDRSEIDAVVSGFAKKLEKNGQLRLKKDIIRKYKDIHNQENGIVEAEVVTQEKLSSGLEKKIADFVKNRYGAKEVKIENKIDENIKGGVIIRVGNEVLDGSVAKHIKDLKSKLIS